LESVRDLMLFSKEQSEAGAVDLIRVGWKSHKHVAEVGVTSCVSGNQAHDAREIISSRKCLRTEPATCFRRFSAS